MTVFEHDGRLLIVDCGVLFPEEHQPGVDVILPDFSWIRDRLDDVVAIVLTHGHEDHIGAVPYLLRERSDIPVVGSTLTLAFLTNKLGEHRIEPTSVVVAAGDRRSFGPFDLEFAAVNHSIPDGPRARDPDGGRPARSHRRLQDGPVPAGRADHRPAHLCAMGRGVRRPAAHRLDERGGAGVHGVRAGAGTGHRRPSSAPPLDG